MDRLRRLLAALSLTLAVGMAGASGAGAAIVGTTHYGIVGCGGEVVRLATDAPVPSAGIITSLSHGAGVGNPGEKTAYLVLHPEGAGAYTVIGTTGQVIPAANGGIETFPTTGPVSVQAGDVLGFWVPPTGVSGCANDFNHTTAWATVAGLPGFGTVVHEGARDLGALNVAAHMPAAGQRSLDVALFGGGSVSGAGIACGADCTEDYTAGTQVTLTAAPANAEWRFVGWTGACSGEQSATCTVTLNASKATLARFIEVAPLLTVYPEGPGGTVRSSPAGIDCGSDCSERFDPGTKVRLTAIPDAGQAFVVWTFGPCANSENPVCDVTMDASQSAQARFLPGRTLTLDTAGAGTGDVLLSSEYGTRTCSHTQAPCTFVLPQYGAFYVFGAPADDSTLTGYAGDCVPYDYDFGRICVFTMNDDRTITTAFGLKRHLRVNPTGGGTVTSAPAGISCPTRDGGPGACEAGYADGTVVTLTAHPENGFTFAGFTGCDTAASTRTVPTTCTVTLDGDRDVTAAFTGGGGGHAPGGSSGGGPATPTPGPTGAGGVAGNVYSDPSIELLSSTGLVRQFDLKLTCGTLACGGIPSATLTLAGQTIGAYGASSSRLAAGDSVTVHLATSKAVRRKLRKARRKHPHARPRLSIQTVFGLSNRKTVLKSLKLRLA